MRDLKLAAQRSASGYRQDKKKKKPRADYEPCSAHGRAVNKQHMMVLMNGCIEKKNDHVRPRLAKMK